MVSLMSLGGYGAQLACCMLMVGGVHKLFTEQKFNEIRHANKNFAGFSYTVADDKYQVGVLRI